MRRAFPNQNVVVRNYGDAGGSARGFLDSNRIDQILQELPQINIAYLRYGINDRKIDGVSGCIRYLRLICERLKEARPDVAIIIETNIWVDYPQHNLRDRNARLAPLYEAMRRFAEKDGYPVVDIFKKMEEETGKGHWDLRVR